jgi:N-formylglutamate amidohydrolase
MVLYFKEGNTPIILVSTHGGLRRRGFTITTHKSADKNVNKTLFSIEKALKKKQIKPYIILSKVHRSVVDLNRPYEKTHGKENAKIWSRYHQKLDSYIQTCLRKYGKCFIFDLHGHKRNREVHLGYGLNNADIRGENWQKSSITPLARQFNIHPKKLIFGTHSLCEKLERKGIHCIPSDRRRMNLRKYLNGGFITRHYSKKYYALPIAVIQIELPAAMRQQHSIQKSGKLLANTLHSFVNQSALKRKKIKSRKKVTKKKKPRRRQRTRRRRKE